MMRCEFSRRLDHLAFVVVLWAAAGAVSAASPTTELLWPDGAARGRKGNQPADKPTLTVWLPDAAKANGAAVVICPGGGYGGLALGHEGHDIAAWLNSFGVAGFILEYRHRGKGYGHPAPLEDGAVGDPHRLCLCQRVEDRPDADRHHGIFRGRAPCFDRGNALRSGRSGGGRPDRAC